MTEPLNELLQRLSERGVRLFVEDGRLGYDAPVGAFDDELTQAVVARKPEILALLERQRPAAPLPVEPVEHMPIEGPVPLSFAQRRMWFSTIWDPTGTGYNMPMVYDVDGAFDIDRLQHAVDRTIREHPILHSVYRERDGEPYQLALPELSVAVSTVEVGAEGGDEAAELQAFFGRPFRLDREPPLRVLVLTRGEAAAVVALCLHHIAGDARTNKLLTDSLARHYTEHEPERSEGAENAERLVYTDFVRWETEAWSAGRFDAQLSHWRTRLADHLEPVTVPGDRRRPTVGGEDGDTIVFEFDAELQERVEESCRQRAITPFVFFLTAAQLLLGRYSGSNRVSVGSTIAGRNLPEFDDVMGCFINTVVFVADHDPASTLADCLERNQSEVLDALDHQDLPFHTLVDELDIRRDLSHAPLFQNMFVYDNLAGGASARGTAFGEARLRQRTHERQTSKADTTIRLRERRDGYSGRLTFRTDLFHRATMERYRRHFVEVVEALLDNPGQQVGELALGSVDEQRTALDTHLDTPLDTPLDTVVGSPSAPGDDRLVIERFHDAVDANPSKLAVRYEDETVTYAELDRRADALARRILGASPGQPPNNPARPVAVLAERSVEAVVAVLAALKSGTPYVPLDPASPPARIARVLEAADPCWVLTTAEVAIACPGVLDEGLFADRCLFIDATDPPHDGGRVVPGTTADDLMYIIFTSGSTGEPKGVKVGHGNFRNYLNGLVAHVGLDEGWDLAMVTTFAADLNTTTLYGALTTGSTLHVIGYERAVSPADLADYFRRHPIDLIKIAPSHFSAVIDGGPDVIPNRCIVFSGEACSWELVRTVRRLRPEVRIDNHYGPTETTVSAMMHTIGPDLPDDPPGVVPIGRPIGGVDALVLDEGLRPVPVGVRGQLFLGGPGVSHGYLNRDDLTAVSFHEALAVAPGRRYYASGDQVRINNRGEVEFLGRADNQVKIRGYRVELDEVRLACVGHELCADAVVRAYEVAPGVQGLVAYVVLADGDAHDAAIARIRSDLRTELPDYLRPNVIVAIERIPVTANGKLDAAALPPPRAERDASVEAVAPRNADEQRLADAWRNVLGVDTLGIDDDFFDLGGDSFTAIKLMNSLDGPLSVMDLFQRPTIRGLASLLDGDVDGDGSAGGRGLVTRMRAVGEERVSLVCVPFGGGSAISYQPMSYQLRDGYALYAVALPGHEYDRQDEPLAPLPEVAAQAAAEVIEKCRGAVYVYGHCLGASMALAIAHELEAAGTEVAGVFLAGSLPTARPDGALFRLAARLFPRDRWGSNLRYQQLMASLGASGMDDEDQVGFVIRNLRHDSRQAEDYNSAVLVDADYEKIKAPVLCLFGEYDPATEHFMTRYEAWGAHAEHVDVAMVPRGGHFFLKELSGQIIEVIEHQRGVWSGAADGLPPQFVPEPEERLAIMAESRRQVRPGFGRFLRVVVAVFLSGMGAQMLAFGLGVWVLEETGSVLGFAATLFFSRMPNILLLPVGGAVADKVDRRLVLIISTAVMIVASGSLAAAYVTVGLSLWMVYTHAAVVAVGAAFADPTYLAARTQLVPRHYLAYSNGIAQLGGSLINFSAPTLGAFFMVWLGIEAMLVLRLATGLAALAILAVTAFPRAVTALNVEPFTVSLRQGFLFILRRRGMVAMVLFFMVSNFTMGVITAQITPMVLGFASVAAVGYVTSSRALGGIAGALVASVWGGFRRRATGMVGFVLLSGVSAVLIGAQPAVWLVAGGVFGMGMAQVLTNTHWETIIQSKVGVDLQGRVFATNRMMARSALPLGILAGGALAPVASELTVQGGWVAERLGGVFGVGVHRGQALILVGSGVVLTVWAFAGLRYRPLRYVEDDIPDAISYEGMEGDLDALQQRFDELYQARSVSPSEPSLSKPPLSRPPLSKPPLSESPAESQSGPPSGLVDPAPEPPLEVPVR